MNLQSITPTESNVLRVETLAARITSEEMRAVKTAARNSGSSCSEWLREAALAFLQEPIERSDNTPIEVTILEEVTGLRLLMVNLFAGANPGVALQTVHQLMAHADAVKHEAAKVVRRSSEGQGTKWHWPRRLSGGPQLTAENRREADVATRAGLRGECRLVALKM